MIRSSLVLGMLSISISAPAMDSALKREEIKPKPIIAIDLSVLSERENPDTAAQQSEEAGKKLFKSFSRGFIGAKLWFNKDEIDQKGKELAKKHTGTTNITHMVLSEYGVNKDEIFELTKAAVNPQLKKDELTFIHELKKQGFKIVGITGQDHVHHQIFREKTTEFQIDQLLEGVVTIPYVGDERYADNKFNDLETWFQEHKDRWFIAKPGCQNSACQALRALVDSIDKDAQIVLIEMKKETSAQSSTANITSVPYETIEQLKKQMQDMKIIS